MADESKCPVDHSQRSTWIQKMGGNPHKEAAQAQEATGAAEACPVDHSARARWMESVAVSTKGAPEAIEVDGCSSDKLKEEPKLEANSTLPLEREISSIPRTDTRTNWIYPSQKQFFEAMKRKKWNPEANDMLTVVPIHNHVNELAWRHILNWERYNLETSNQKCGGISLTSFKGDLKKLTPRAWIKSSLFGQEKPFDRHDWTVDRCGVEVPYVLDFYSEGEKGGVFVDVRPKINSWEGFKLRIGRALGWA